MQNKATTDSRIFESQRTRGNGVKEPLHSMNGNRRIEIDELTTVAAEYN